MTLPHFDPSDVATTMDDDAFRQVAGQMLDHVLEAARRTAEAMAASGTEPDDFGDALLAGIIQGAVTAAYRVTPREYRPAVMQYLREYLEIAIENEEATLAEGSLLQ